MRKLIVFNMITVDGYFAGPQGEIDWHNVDQEFNDFAIQQLDELDTLLFGRITYELMAGYWPTPEGIKDDPTVAKKMNELPKIVFSKTLADADWNNSRVVKDNIEEEMDKMKSMPGKTIAIFGSGNLIQTFMSLGLIDEYRLMVCPVILGKGKPLFSDVKEKLSLKLSQSKTFNNGNILLYYQKLP